MADSDPSAGSLAGRAVNAGALAGRAVIVTGGASGIGKAVATLAGGAGASVTVADRDEELVAKAGAELAAAGVPVVACVVDVTSESDIKRMVDETVGSFGRIDGLVTSAGIAQPRPALETSLEHFENVLRVNLTGTFLCAKAVARHMIDSGNAGSIVTISSALAFSGGPAQSHYVASKSGIIALTKNLALEWGPQGIRVNSVAPGVVETPILSAITDEHRAAYVERTPLGRIGNPDDIAKVVRFFLSDDSSYVTGQTIAVNGGYSMPS